MAGLWNVAEITDEDAGRELRSPPAVTRVAEEHFGARPIKILEIGVFRGGLTKRFRASGLHIVEYVGVDPYLGSGDDPYLGSYWSSADDATKLYLETKRLFDEHGWELVRQRSKDFFELLDSRAGFDLIYVDGDHRYNYALWDMLAFFGVLNDDGLMMIDDYANVDVPGVTTAFNDFVRLARPNIARLGYLEGQFRNRGKFVPVSQFTTYVLPVARSVRKPLALPLVEETPTARPKMLEVMLDASPRKVVNWLRRAARGAR